MFKVLDDPPLFSLRVATGATSNLLTKHLTYYSDDEDSDLKRREQAG